MFSTTSLCLDRFCPVVLSSHWSSSRRPSKYTCRPFDKYCSTRSACLPNSPRLNASQSMYMGTSSHCPVWLFFLRLFTAKRTLATLPPLAKLRTSGSAVSLPINMTLLRFAMMQPPGRPNYPSVALFLRADFRRTRLARFPRFARPAPIATAAEVAVFVGRILDHGLQCQRVRIASERQHGLFEFFENPERQVTQDRFVKFEIPLDG